MALALGFISILGGVPAAFVGLACISPALPGRLGAVLAVSDSFAY